LNDFEVYVTSFSDVLKNLYKANHNGNLYYSHQNL